MKKLKFSGLRMQLAPFDTRACTAVQVLITYVPPALYVRLKYWYL